MSDEPRDQDAEGEGALRVEHVRSVRLGHGANCSSVGSVIDTLFATAVVGTALYAAILAALERERAAPKDDDATPAPRDGSEGAG